MEPYWSNQYSTLYLSDSRNIPIPDNSIHCAVTSPPYYGLRHYKLEPSIWGGDPSCQHYFLPPENQFCSCGAWCGFLGQEPYPELYVEHIVLICREVKRVLRKDGVFWFNIGDSFSTNGSGSRPDKKRNDPTPPASPYRGNLEAGNIIGIPWLTAFALQKDGWILRSPIIWQKSSAIPESLDGWRWEHCRIKNSESNEIPDNLEHKWKDCPGCEKCLKNNGYVLRQGSWRPTMSHEFIFMLTKEMNYYSDREAVKEIAVYSMKHKGARKQGGPKAIQLSETDNRRMPMGISIGEDKRNPRSVINESEDNNIWRWLSSKFSPEEINNLLIEYQQDTGALSDIWKINPQPYKGDHFAAFPERLPDLCIKASTSEKGVCPSCGAQWARLVKRERIKYSNSLMYRCDDRNDSGEPKYQLKINTLDWQLTCSCNAGNPVPAKVLDPFSGTARTLISALKLGRYGIGCDLSPDYMQQAIIQLSKTDNEINKNS